MVVRCVPVPRVTASSKRFRPSRVGRLAIREALVEQAAAGGGPGVSTHRTDVVLFGHNIRPYDALC